MKHFLSVLATLARKLLTLNNGTSPCFSWACHADIQQAFSRMYRQDVGDCLINAFYVLRTPMLGSLINMANGQLSQVQLSPTSNPSTEPLEATLFCIQAVHEAVEDDEDTHLPQLFAGPLFATIAGVSGNSDSATRLKRTTLLLIGESMKN